MRVGWDSSAYLTRLTSTQRSLALTWGLVQVSLHSSWTSGIADRVFLMVMTDAQECKSTARAYFRQLLALHLLTYHWSQQKARAYALFNMRPKQVTEDWKVKMDTKSQAGRMTQGRAPGPRLHRELTQATETPLQPCLQGAGMGVGGKEKLSLWRRLTGAMEGLGVLLQMRCEALNEGFEPTRHRIRHRIGFKRSLRLLCGEQTVEVKDGS